MIKAQLVEECSAKSEPLLSEYTVQYGAVPGDKMSSGQPPKTYTSDTKIRKSFKCYFYQPTKAEANNATKLHCQCVLCEDVIQLLAVTGEVFSVPLVFPVESIWPIDGGLLIERAAGTPSTASNTGGQSSVEEGLPVMFSLLHPLDDISPVVCRYPSTGVGDHTILGYQCDPNMIVVYSSCDPSILICCDVIGGRHSAWTIRPASDQDIPPVKNSVSDISGSMTPSILNLSPAGKLFPSTPSLPYPLQPTPSQPLKGHPSAKRDSARYHTAQRESPFGTGAALLSPHKPMPIPNTAQQIPGITPPRIKGSLSPVTLSPYAHTFQSSGSSWSTEEQSLNYLLLPNSCLKLIWEETNVPLTRTVTREHSTQVFFTEDVCNRKYLVLLLPVDKQLRLLECTVKDGQNIQFGLTHDIPASHAVPLMDLPLIVILSPNGQVLLCSGHMLVGQICIDNGPTIDTVTSVISDCSRSHVTLVTSSDTQLLCCVPTFPSHPLVTRIIAGLVQVLPTAEACEALIHHYQYSHVFSYDKEWCAFQLWLTTMMGVKCYPPVQPSTPVDDSKLLNWQKVLKTTDPMLFRCTPALSYIYRHQGYNRPPPSLPLPTILKVSVTLQYVVTEEPLIRLHGLASCPHHGLWFVPWISVTIADSVIHGPALLRSYRNVIAYVMHLLYEDMKLSILYNANLEEMAILLHHIASQLQWEQYVDHYCRDFPFLFTKSVATNDHVSIDEDIADFSHITIATTPPHIMQWLLRKLEGKEVAKFPIISNFTSRLNTVIKLCGLYCWHADYPLGLEELVAPIDDGQSCSQEFQLACESYKNLQQEDSSYHARVILCLAQEGFTPKDFITLPVGMSLLVQDCVTKCQHVPPANWPMMAYEIIGREDIVKSLQPILQNTVQGRMQAHSDKDDDGMQMDYEVLNLRFSEDLRINEVRKLLSSTQPVRIALTQLPEVSDHEFIEQQETRLLAVCQRTMALPIGRGMLTFSTCHPVPTAALFIPNLTLSGRAPPRNTTVGIDHIGCPPNMEMWPEFHNLVSAGLSVIPGLPHLDSAWIGYNKRLDWESTSNWAGFLMAMGLQGYLSQLTADRIYSITDKNHHELTTIGLLLGLAAEKCGSMDPQVAQLLALHCQPLLPSGSAELDVTHSVQVAALLGTGLLYMGSTQRHLVEVMLKEIGSPPGPELEYAVDRESYSLAAGLSLGMITLGCGNDLPGMTDLDLIDQLYHYINGGIKKTTGSATKTGTHLILEGEHVNTHVTTAGAVMALTLMFLKTNNASAANGLTTPDTLYQLEAIRPDFLLLRVLGHSLIMWDSVQPTNEWIQQHIPKLVQQHAFGKKSDTADEAQVDYETVSQAEVNIISGCCMSLGFRFAGTSDPDAFKILLYYNKYLLSRIESPVAVDQAGRSCLEGCLNASLLALAMVMCGSGNLEVMRLVKKLRVRITTPEVTYGSHMAIHMSLGLLFLGGGRYSLSTGNKAVATMLCSFYPKFPSTSVDNRYHLQALRHLYVLAAERRVLVTINNDSNKICSVPVCIKTGDGELTAMSPCIVPPWEDISEIKICGPRYWEFSLNIPKSNSVTTTGIVFVKRRVGHLPYEDDKDGRCGSLSLAMLTSRHHQAVHVDSTAINHNVLDDTNLKNFWDTSIKEKSPWNVFCSNVLTECVADEKLNVIPLYLQLEQLCHQSSKVNPTKMLDLWQFKLCQMLCSAELTTEDSQENAKSVMSTEYLHSVEMSLLSKSEAKRENNEEGLDELLAHYIRGDQAKVLSMEDAELLATALLLYDIPSKHIIQLDSNTTLPNLYLQLKSLGVSATAVARLLPLLQL